MGLVGQMKSKVPSEVEDIVREMMAIEVSV
jgi:hypothetical protein